MFSKENDFRFLSCCPIGKSQLQLAAAACLLLTAKLHRLDHVTVALLVEYTDHCYTPAELVAWERLLLVKLAWRAAPTTPLAFVDQLTAGRGHQLRSQAVDMILMSAGDPALTAADPYAVAVTAVELVLESTTKAAAPSSAAVFDADVDHLISQVERELITARGLKGTEKTTTSSTVIRDRLRHLLLEDGDSGFDETSRGSFTTTTEGKFDFGHPRIGEFGNPVEPDFGNFYAQFRPPAFVTDV